jgi:hypothetical protein
MKPPSETIASCADSSCELLISPIPRPQIQEVVVSTRPKRRRVMLVDSRKPNSIVVLRQVAELLRAQHVEVVAEIPVKDDPSRPMDGPVLDWIAREEGLILCGIAD